MQRNRDGGRRAAHLTPVAPLVDPAAVPPGEPWLLSPREAARRLAVSDQTIYRMLDAGQLRERRYGSRRLIYTVSVLEWLRQQTPPL